MKKIDNTLNKDLELYDSFDISLQVIDTAEAFKHIQGGFKEKMIKNCFLEVGFSEVKVEYNWFFGQGFYLHSTENNNDISAIEKYLQNSLPMSRHLFKYISVYAKK